MQGGSRQVESSGKGHGVEVGSHAPLEFKGSQGGVWLTDLAFSMNPTRFNRIKPGTLLGQQARQLAHIGCTVEKPYPSVLAGRVATVLRRYQTR